PYLDQHYEYYSSGQFFTNVHDTAGEQVHQRAMAGDLVALKIFSEFGKHLGNALTAILYALDPATIILGGSVSKGYPFFREAMWSQIKKIAYRSIPDRLTIELSSEKDIAVLGAAALCYDPDAGYSEFEPEKTSR
ncbi:MAG: ROK family protein, partial [Saprospiraceae bacterium]|nr:ROK family protein [Saprospiraceae bacterium]